MIDLIGCRVIKMRAQTGKTGMKYILERISPCYGTDTGIWKSEKEPISYIRPGKLAPEEDGQDAESAEDMAQEENFAEFIKSVDESGQNRHEVYT